MTKSNYSMQQTVLRATADAERWPDRKGDISWQLINLN